MIIEMLVAFFLVLKVFGIFGSIRMIGQPRKPLTPSVAVAILITNVAEIAVLQHLLWRP